MRAFATFLLVALSLVFEQAHACDRALTIFHDLSVAVATADVVALVDVTRVGGGSADVTVVRTFAGRELRAGEALTVEGVHSTADQPMRTFCGESPMDLGKRYIVIAWDPNHSGKLVPVDAADGIVTDSAANVERVALAVASPAKVSRWKVEGSIASRLVRAVDAQRPDEVDLYVLVQNRGPTPIDMTRRVWPEDQQSRCSLDLTAGRTHIAPRRVPIAEADIRGYFDKHAPAPWTQRVEPRHVHVIPLWRVTTAAQGWGYKEELGFRYWPIPPGPRASYRIVATCERFLDRPIATDALTLEL